MTYEIYYDGEDHSGLTDYAASIAEANFLVAVTPGQDGLPLVGFLQSVYQHAPKRAGTTEYETYLVVQPAHEVDGGWTAQDVPPVLVAPEDVQRLRVF